MEWREFEGADCPLCGGSCEVLTKSKKKNWVYDGEEARCTDCENTGYTSCDDELATVYWNKD